MEFDSINDILSIHSAHPVGCKPAWMILALMAIDDENRKVWARRGLPDPQLGSMALLNFDGIPVG